MNGADSRTCAACGRQAPARTRFCGSCGAALEAATPDAGTVRGAARRNAPRERVRARRLDRALTRAVASTALVYVGVLIALIAIGLLTGDETAAVAAFTGVEIGLGHGAILVRGGDSWRESFANRPQLRDCLAAVPVGMASFVLAWFYVALLRQAFGWSGHGAPISPTMMVAAVLLAPLLEEWLCRGVLWNAVAPFTSRNERIAATAVLFGMLHCLDGVLAFPHRFVGGLLYGWLRDRSRSLVPGILAHAVHNLLASCL